FRGAEEEGVGDLARDVDLPVVVLDAPLERDAGRRALDDLLRRDLRRPLAGDAVELHRRALLDEVRLEDPDDERIAPLAIPRPPERREPALRGGELADFRGASPFGRGAARRIGRRVALSPA